MSRPKIVVIGSSNIDMVVKSERIPRGGETVLGGEFVMVPGGKGANQAVCAAKLGADVKFIARIGNDMFGEASLKNFNEVGINTEFVLRDSDNPNGVALIVVDENGENAIVVAPGANHALSPEDIDRAGDAITAADAVILQLEIPIETVVHSIELARSLGVRVVLNPAPIRPLPIDVLKNVDVLIPNQHEAADLLGKKGKGSELDAPDAAKELMALGAKCIVITLGARGAYVATDRISKFIEPMKVKPVDTTAAGDSFTAALTCALAEGLDLPDAAQFASRVAAITVTGMGAQSSLPLRKDVESYIFGN